MSLVFANLRKNLHHGYVHLISFQLSLKTSLVFIDSSFFLLYKIVSIIPKISTQGIGGGIDTACGKYMKSLSFHHFLIAVHTNHASNAG